MFDKSVYLNRMSKYLEADLDLFIKLGTRSELHQKIVDKLLEWHAKDNLAIFSIFGISHRDYYLFASLSSFLIDMASGCVSFKIKWEKYVNGEYVDGEPWKDNPKIWIVEDPKVNDLEILWKVFEHWELKDRERIERNKLFLKMLEEYQNRIDGAKSQEEIEGFKMNKPDMTKQVSDRLSKFAEEHNISRDDLNIRWDGLFGCWCFEYDGIFYGIETNGYLHS